MRLARALTAVVLLVAAHGGAAPAATAASLDEYKATAAKWLPLLPPAPDGWTRTKPTSFVVNSAFQKAMEVRSIYHQKSGQGQIGIFIGAKPGFRPDFRQKAFDDEAVAKKQGYVHKTVDGRKWLVKANKENVNYVTILDRNIVILLAGKWVTPAQVEAMLPKFDYKGIAAVK